MNKTRDLLEKWCSGTGIKFQSPDAEDSYKKRAGRIADAVQLKVPDRTPIAPLCTFFPAFYAGITPQDAMYDHDKAYAAFKKTALDFQWDVAPTHLLALPATVYEILDYRQLKWPGHGVSANRSFQFVEDEYMKADEYDAFLDDPSDYIIRTYLPRICGALEPLRNIPPIQFLMPYYMGLSMMLGGLAFGGAASAFEAVLKAMGAFMKYGISLGTYIGEMQSLGFPVIQVNSATQAPFDTLGDSFRGTKGMMLDMYRQPDNLLKAVEKLLPIHIAMGISGAAQTQNPFVFIPLHKGSMGFMSLQQFQTFYWPTLQALIVALTDQGIVPNVLFESDYTDRLDIIKDVPPGKVIYWFEKTDIFKAKQILGDRVCIKGNVSAALLCTGTSDQVKDYCKQLIDVVGKDGGLIVDGDIGIPDEAKTENVKAMTEFVKEYGVYK